MKINEYIRYVSYKIVEILNDKIGQLLIATLFASILVFMTGVDYLTLSQTKKIIAFIGLIVAVFVIVLMKNLDFVSSLKVEDRLRVFRFLKLFSLIVLVVSTFPVYPVHSTIVGMTFRLLLAIFLLASILTKSNSMYLSDDK